VERIIKGDLLALIGSLSSAYFLIMNSETENEYPPYFGIGFMTFIASVLLMLLSLIFEGARLDNNPTNGILGLFSMRFNLFL
jgi:drug/metabolite transporter (DMT)-like permease